MLVLADPQSGERARRLQSWQKIMGMSPKQRSSCFSARSSIVGSKTWGGVMGEG